MNRKKTIYIAVAICAILGLLGFLYVSLYQKEGSIHNETTIEIIDSNPIKLVPQD